MFDVGRLCLKVAGRDGNNYCVIVENVNDKYVIIDGNVRRKKCNVKHLEPLATVLKIKEGASRDEVIKAMTEANIKVKELKERRKKEGKEKPRKIRKKNVKEANKK